MFLIDNSQGHSAYAEDALLTSRMNVKPGGKQAFMRDGWYINESGERVIQKMVFPPDHPHFPNQAKGMKEVVSEWGIDTKNMIGRCKGRCNLEKPDCCLKRVLELQADFLEQKSLVQEVIEAKGHICIFLPKFHCELNFIEIFWGRVKKYLRDHCDYTFDTLKENMPTALASVDIQTILCWEYRTFRWIAAYRSGMDTNAAQYQVREFSSQKYKSHRWPPKFIAQIFDFD